MNIQITSDNIEISDSMKVLATSKLGVLERYWTEIPDDNKKVRVVMNSGPNDTFLVKIEANLDGTKLYTEEPGFELETALVDAVEELARKYKKHKTMGQQEDWEMRRESKGLSEEDLKKESATDEEVVDYSSENPADYTTKDD